MDAAAMDTEITDHLLSTTRSVRKRLDLDRPVGREVVLDCLRLACQAPTGSNNQGWRWIVVSDPALKAELGELYRRGGADYMARKLAEPDQSDTDRRVRSSAAYLLDVIDRVPLLVIPCIQGRVDGGTNGQVAGFYGSIIPAAWSFMLALRSRGLGSVWTTFHLAYEAEAARLLGIPDDISQIAMLPVAYTIGTDFKPAKRGPVEEITFWDRWGEQGGDRD